MALLHATTHETGSRVVILSDSKSVITAIKNIKYNSPIPVHLMEIVTTIQLLIQRHTNLSVQWVPSHCGLHYNTLVDRLAVLSSQRGTITNDTTTFHTDCYSIIERANTEEWVHQYSTATGAGSWTRDLITNPLRRPWFQDLKNLPVKSITTINRLLAGHAFNGRFRFTVGHRENPFCDLCHEEQVQSVSHILLECRATRPTMISVLHNQQYPDNLLLTPQALITFLREGLNKPEQLLNLQEALKNINAPV
uniref:Ribonuclease H n=2 Tax=Lygus hesperus TaxID=30085 RepID=A0A0A9WF19_LYGHE